MTSNSIEIARLTLDSALELAEKAIQLAADNTSDACICVVDRSGFVIVKLRTDGVDLLAVEMSEAKARTAALTRYSTALLADGALPGGPLFGIQAFDGGRLVTIAGGEPIASAGTSIGAIGVSGGSPDDDRRIALAAIEQWSKGS